MSTKKQPKKITKKHLAVLRSVMHLGTDATAKNVATETGSGCVHYQFNRLDELGLVVRSGSNAVITVAGVYALSVTKNVDYRTDAYQKCYDVETGTVIESSVTNVNTHRTKGKKPNRTITVQTIPRRKRSLTP